MKLILSADIHLDSPLRGLAARGDGAAAMTDATRRAFDALVALCESEAADALLIAGDLYDDDWKDFSTGLWLTGRLARLRAAGVRVYMVRGNHDAENTITRHLPLPDGVTLFASRRAETVVDQALGLAVHGRSFPRREVSDNLAATYPPPLPGLVNVGLLHTALAGAEGHAPYAPCTLDQLKAHGYQVWALGHVHQRQILSTEPLIAYPGNLQGRHVRETGAKGALVVEITPGAAVRVRFVALDVLRWANLAVDLSPCADAEAALAVTRRALADALAEADGRPLAVRLRLHGATAAHAALAAPDRAWLAALEAAAIDLGTAGEPVWLESVAVETVPTLDRAALLARDDPWGEVLRATAGFGDDPAARAAFQAVAAPLLARLAEVGVETAGTDDLAAEAERLLLAALAGITDLPAGEGNGP